MVGVRSYKYDLRREVRVAIGNRKQRRLLRSLDALQRTRRAGPISGQIQVSGGEPTRKNIAALGPPGAEQAQAVAFKRVGEAFCQIGREHVIVPYAEIQRDAAHHFKVVLGKEAKLPRNLSACLVPVGIGAGYSIRRGRDVLPRSVLHVGLTVDPENRVRRIDGAVQRIEERPYVPAGRR